MNRFLSGVLVLLLMVIMTACGDRSPEEPTAAPTDPPTATPAPTPTPTALPAPSTVLEIATAAGNFQTLLDAVAAADLAEKLNSEGPYTLFAPTDFAFSEAPPGLMADSDARTDTLLYHIVEGDLAAADLTTAADATSLLGDSLTVTTEGDQIFVNGAPIAIADIEADNGVIHVMQTVLVPPSLADQFAAAEDATAPTETDADGSESAAPANESTGAQAGAAVADAVDAAQAGAQEAVAVAEEGAAAVAQRAGEAATAVQDAAASAAEAIEAPVDEAISAAGSAAETAGEEMTARVAAEFQTVTEAARNSGQTVTLLAGVEAAGLIETLQAAGPYTVFAPIDSAFAELPESVIQALVREPSSALKGVLSYHVALGAFSLDELRALEGQTLATLNGEPLTISIDPEGEVLVDGSGIQGAPIRAGNGYIYLIDNVLIPVIEE